MKQYNKFNEVEHTPLRAFNRVARMYNIQEDDGADAAREYAASFSDVERRQMMIIIVAIEKFGVDSVRKQVTKNLVTTYDPNDDLGYEDIEGVTV